MKKLSISMLSLLLIAACLVGCGNTAKTDTTLNITETNFLTLIADIYKNPTDYTGRTIKIEGLCGVDNHNSHSHYYVYRNAPVYDPGHGHNHIQKIGFEIAYNGSFPKENEWIEVVGVLRTDNKNKNTFLTLDVNSVTVLSRRGAETIGGTEAVVHEHGGEHEHFN